MLLQIKSEIIKLQGRIFKTYSETRNHGTRERTFERIRKRELQRKKCSM